MHMIYVYVYIFIYVYICIYRIYIYIYVLSGNFGNDYNTPIEHGPVKKMGSFHCYANVCQRVPAKKARKYSN